MIFSREGKTLKLDFSGKQILEIHLMLRGDLTLIDQRNPSSRFEIMGIHLMDASGFAVVDMLKMDTPTLNPEISTVPDTLGDDMNISYFLALLSKKRTFIKNVLRMVT